MSHALRLAKLAGRPLLLASSAAPAMIAALAEPKVKSGGMLRGLGRALGLVDRAAGDVQEGGDVDDGGRFAGWPAPPAAPGAERCEEGYFLTEEGVAILEISGCLWDRAWFRWQGPLSAYDEIGDALREARADEHVNAIMLRIDSPGGLVDGLFGLIDAISKGAGRQGGKPIWAFTTAACFSAAYAIASACDRIVAAPEGEVGSIGAVVLHINEAGWLAEAGYEIQAIEFPEGKTDGAWWAALSDDARASMQARIKHVARMFIDHVAAHRGLDEDEIIALRADCFSADDAEDGGRSALQLGLIDEIAFEPAAYAALVLAGQGKTPAPVSAPDPAPDPAAAAALETGDPDMTSKELAQLQAAAKKGDKVAAAKLQKIAAIVAEAPDDEEDQTVEDVVDDEDVVEDDEEDQTALDEEDDAEAEDGDAPKSASAAGRKIGRLANRDGKSKLGATLAADVGSGEMTYRAALRTLRAAGRESSPFDRAMEGGRNGAPPAKPGQAKAGDTSRVLAKMNQRLGIKG